MKTKIKTVHEEEYSDKSKIIGILLNYSIEDDWSESFPYIFKNGTYIFFNTIIELMDYMLYGENKMKRAYIEEIVFDSYYDAEYIINNFGEILVWTQ